MPSTSTPPPVRQWSTDQLDPGHLVRPRPRNPDPQPLQAEGRPPRSDAPPAARQVLTQDVRQAAPCPSAWSAGEPIARDHASFRKTSTPCASISKTISDSISTARRASGSPPPRAPPSDGTWPRRAGPSAPPVRSQGGTSDMLAHPIRPGSAVSSRSVVARRSRRRTGGRRSRRRSPAPRARTGRRAVRQDRARRSPRS